MLTISVEQNQKPSPRSANAFPSQHDPSTVYYSILCTILIQPEYTRVAAHLPTLEVPKPNSPFLLALFRCRRSWARTCDGLYGSLGIEVQVLSDAASGCPRARLVGANLDSEPVYVVLRFLLGLLGSGDLNLGLARAFPLLALFVLLEWILIASK